MSVFKCHEMLALTTQSEVIEFFHARLIAQKESFQSTFPPKTHRNTHEEPTRRGRDERLIWPLS